MRFLIIVLIFSIELLGSDVSKVDSLNLEQKKLEKKWEKLERQKYKQKVDSLWPGDTVWCTGPSCGVNHEKGDFAYIRSKQK